MTDHIIQVHRHRLQGTRKYYSKITLVRRQVGLCIEHSSIGQSVKFVSNLIYHATLILRLMSFVSASQKLNIILLTVTFCLPMVADT